LNRRHFVESLGLASLASVLPATPLVAERPPSTIKPRRLAPGDTVALVSPASATFNSIDLQIATESLAALGFKVKTGAHLFAF
jgi:muramoyltetrapeptide carboxypeptidase